MGANEYTTLAFGRDAKDAHRRAVQDALWEHGHDPYGGHIGTRSAGVVDCGEVKGLTARRVAELTLQAMEMSYDGEWNEPEGYLTRGRYRGYGEYEMEWTPKAKARFPKGYPLPTVSTVRAANDKWDGPSLGFRLTGKAERLYRERAGLKGRRGGVWLFIGIAPS